METHASQVALLARMELDFRSVLIVVQISALVDEVAHSDVRKLRLSPDSFHKHLQIT